MKADASTYLHVLAFECPRCKKPVVEWMLSTMRNLEAVDASPVKLQCTCGWTDRLLGAQARGHVVLPWAPLGEVCVETPEQEPEQERLANKRISEPDTGNPV